MNRGLHLCLLPLAVSSCVTLDFLLFNPTKVDEFRWDADPCDPQLTGDLSVARHERLGGPEPTCHPSIVPPENRVEGLVDSEHGEKIHYVYAHRDDADTTIFYSHGNKAHIGNYWERVELMWELGYNVMIYDYPGFGRSSGEPSEEGCYAAAEAVLDLLPTLPGVDPERVFFYGFSLGGGPTYELALRAVRDQIAVRPRGVLSESAFCSVNALVHDGSHTSLRAEYFSDAHFDNCAKIDAVASEIPVMIIHGEIDDFVVPRHADLLVAATDEEVELHWAESSVHSDIPVMVPDDYAEWLSSFLDR
jgi:alpha-beta hydrolase superfamily lysophospholipase